MASLLPVRAARSVSCSACRSLTFSTPAQLTVPILRRNFSTPAEQQPVDYSDKPRWSYTPPRTKAPFSLRFDSKRRDYPVNSDPKLLDQFYIRFFGDDGDKVLSDEVKWLAVTHKSFDQGRRGFNDRLAFLGMLPFFFFCAKALIFIFIFARLHFGKKATTWHGLISTSFRKTYRSAAGFSCSGAEPSWDLWHCHP